MANASRPSTQPVKVFRLRGISASVFENTSDKRSFYKISIVRTYKDGKDFKTTPTFSRDDLPIAAYLAGMAWQHVLQLEQDPKSERDSE